MDKVLPKDGPMFYKPSCNQNLKLYKPLPTDKKMLIKWFLISVEWFYFYVFQVSFQVNDSRFIYVYVRILQVIDRFEIQMSFIEL